MEKIIDRFLRYVAFDTASNPDSQSQPSTNKQFALLEQLRKELQAMGVEQVEVDKNGYLMASIPSNIDGDVPAIGFISHVDTSPDAPGCGIKPRIVENYDGKTLVLMKNSRNSGTTSARHSSPLTERLCSVPTTRPEWPRSCPQRNTSWSIPSSATARSR